MNSRIINTIFILIYIVFTQQSFTQNTDTARVNLLNKHSFDLLSVNTDSAKKIAEEALVIANKIEYKQGIADSYARLGVVAKSQGRFYSALTYFNQSKLLRIDLKDEKNTGESLLAIGNTYYVLGSIDSAIQYYNYALQIQESIGDSSGMAKTFESKGIYYQSIKEFNTAADYYNKCLSIRLHNNLFIDLPYAYLNLGSLFQTLDSFQVAETYYNKCLISAEAAHDKLIIARVYNNLAILYRRQGDNNKTFAFYLKSLSIDKETGNVKNQATTYANISAFYKRQKKFDSAFYYLEKSLSISDSISFLSQSAKNLSNFARLYYITENYQKAADYYNLLNTYNDSLNGIDKLKYIDDLEFKYETEKKNQKILLQDQLLQSKTLRSRIYLISAISLGLILIIGSIIYFQQRKLNMKKTEIANQKIDELLNTQEIKSLNAMMEGQETERKRIAQDLHDRMGSLLSTVKLHFNTLETKMEVYQKDNKEQFGKLNTLIDEAVSEVRKISHNLISGVLLQFGLVPALRELSENIQEAGHLKIDFIVHGIDNRMPAQTEISVYRIIQELLSNILKHAHASEVTIQLTRHNNEVNVLVEDNGKGFDTSKNYEGIGIKNIHSRVEKLNGSFQIDSTPGKGTTSIISLLLGDE